MWENISFEMLVIGYFVIMGIVFISGGIFVVVFNKEIDLDNVIIVILFSSFWFLVLFFLVLCSPFLIPLFIKKGIKLREEKKKEKYKKLEEEYNAWNNK